MCDPLQEIDRSPTPSSRSAARRASKQFFFSRTSPFLWHVRFSACCPILYGLSLGEQRCTSRASVSQGMPCSQGVRPSFMPARRGAHDTDEACAFPGRTIGRLLGCAVSGSLAMQCQECRSLNLSQLVCCHKPCCHQRPQTLQPSRTEPRLSPRNLCSIICSRFSSQGLP